MLDQTVSNFVGKVGLKGLKKFLTRCNEDASLDELAHEFNYPRSSIGRIRDRILKRTYILEDGVIDYLTYQAEMTTLRANQYNEMVLNNEKQQNQLKLIIGGLNAIERKTNNCFENIQRS